MREQIVLPIILAALAMVITGLLELLSPDDEIAAGQFELPPYLKEASGLARADEGTVLAHDDEKGVIHSIALADMEADMEINAVASLGDPPIDGDFEGLAIGGGEAYLVTSTGEIHKFPLGPGLKFMAVEHETLDAGLKDICEIEGLALLGDKLLMACKVAFVNKFKKRLAVFAYSLTERKTSLHFSIEGEALGIAGKIRPTAIDFDDRRYYVIVGRRLLLIDRRTLESTAYKLPKDRHFQPEGLAVMASGELVIVDDHRKGTGRLTRYKSLAELEPLTPEPLL